MESLFLGLDASTQSLTATVLSPGKKILLEKHLVYSRDLPEFQTDNGVLHGDGGAAAAAPVAMFVKALCKMFSLLGKELLGQVKAISISAQQHATVYCRDSMTVFLHSLHDGSAADSLMGPDDLADALQPHLSRPVAPIWMDQSTTAQVNDIRARLPDPGYAARVTGSDLALRFAAAQIRKFAQEDKAAFQQTAKIHLLSSFLTAVLRGDVDTGVDTGDGLGMNLVDVATLEYDDTMLKAVVAEEKSSDGDDAVESLRRKLPAVRSPRSSDGVVAPLAAFFQQRFGFRAGALVALGTGDNPASLIGCGAAAVGRGIVLSLGTSDTMMFASSLRDHQKEAAEQQQQHIGHVFGNRLGSAGSGSDLMRLVISINGSLAREEVLRRCCLDDTEQQQLCSWKQVEEDDSLWNFVDGDEPLLPFLRPEICPHHDAVPLPSFSDDDDAEKKKKKRRLLFRFIASQLCNLRCVFSRAGGGGGGSIFVTGGASANRRILQLVADIFARPIVFAVAPVNTAALGAALVAAGSGGGDGSDDLAFESASILPRPESRAAAEKFFESFKKLL